jgi:dolichol-phosphate mannosyltransferase
LLGTGVRDCDCALKVFRREALEKLLPESKQFFVNTEMLTRARQQHLPVAELGVTHRSRRHGTSTVSIADIPKTLRMLLPFWWSRVLFRSEKQGSKGVGERRTRGKWERGLESDCSSSRAPSLLRSSAPLLLLMVIAAFLCFCRLHSPLLEPEEARYAEIPRQMLAADRWIVPTLHGQDYLDKPPLFYWLVMGSYSLFGVHDWAARLAAGSVAWLTVAVTALWGRRVLGTRAGLCAALILALMPEFIYRGRMLTPNGLLALCTTLALAAGHIARIGPRLQRGWWMLAGIATGLGVMTKGPVALALIVPPLAIVGWLDHRLARVGRGWLGFAAAMLAVAAPWFIAVSIRCPEFLGYFFWFHNVVRFAAPFDHAKPVWSYLPQLAFGLLPWSLLILPMIAWLRRRNGHRPAALGFALAAFVSGLAFFSLSGSKRPVYLVPLLPPLALALGCTLDRLIPRAASIGSWLVEQRSAIAWRIAAVGLLAIVGLGGTALAANVSKSERAIAPVIVAALALGWFVRGKRRANWLSAGTVALGLVALAAHDLLPGYARRFSLKRTAQVDPTASVVFSYPQPFDAVTFYRQDDIRAFGPDHRARLMTELQDAGAALLFVKTHHLNEVLADLPANLEFQTVIDDAGVTAGRVVPRRPALWAGYAKAQ